MFVPELGVSLVKISGDVTPEVVDAVANSSIATLEVAAGLFDNDPGGAKLAAFKTMLARGRVRAASVHATYGGAYDISNLDESARASAVAQGRAAVELAAEIGAGIIVFHASGEPVPDSDRARRMVQATRSLAEIARRCRELGCRAAVELLPRTCLGNTLVEAIALADALGEVGGICLDTNHGAGRAVALPDEVRALGTRLIATHLSDYDGQDEKHAPPGQGVIDWRALLLALRDIDYRGPFNLECVLGDKTSSPCDRVRAAEATFGWLRSLL